MRLVLLGPPGAGKGTRAQVLSHDLNIPHISTGDMLREALRCGSPLGLKAKSFMDLGELVPDDVVIALVKERLEKVDAKDGFILDGFPRTADQGESLLSMLALMKMPLDVALYFKTSLSVIISRLGGRRICDKCGKTYHIVNFKPKTDGICDICSGKLIQRTDDREDAIENRLKVYEKQTEPLINFFEKKNLLDEISGDLEVSDLNIDLEKIFKRRNLVGNRAQSAR